PTPAGLYPSKWKLKAHRRPINNEGLLPWCFKLDSPRGNAFHQYDLPGYAASDGPAGFLDEGAGSVYRWAGPRPMSAARSRVEADGTPVIVFGKYDYGKEAPWKHLATDYRAASLTESELKEALGPVTNLTISFNAK